LLKENGVTLVQETASFAEKGRIQAGDTEYEVKSAIIAAGVANRELPGAEIDGKVVITSREALEMRRPPKRAVVIGAGPVGVELGYIWASYGSDVTVVELLDTLLPQEDADIGRQLKRSFEGRGIKSMVKTEVESVQVKGKTASVKVSGPDGEQALEADTVLVAIGFVPKLEGLNVEPLGLELERGYIAIDDHMQTNAAGVYAIGDITGKLPLAHVAMQQGVIAAEHIAGRDVPVLDYVQMPRATFCQPQVGSIGYTEQGAKDAGYRVKTGRFPLTALGRAVAIGETEGFVKVVADEPTGQVLGIHMIGHDVNDLLGEATMIALLEATTIEVGFAVHAHPTLAEGIKEAALAVDGEAIHIARRRAARPAAVEQGATSA
jgi:dihydrolipoamide dehydrogenase